MAVTTGFEQYDNHDNNNYSRNYDVHFVFNEAKSIRNNQEFYYDNWLDIKRKDDIRIGEIYNRIYNKRAAIWMNSKGDIQYRRSENAKIHTSSMEKVSHIFSNLLHDYIEVRRRYKDNFTDNQTILIHELLLVEGEYFNPTLNCKDINNLFLTREFFLNDKDNLIYRNTFKPSIYLQINIDLEEYVKNDLYKSITLQYIYYISNYNQKKFEYIMDWLAAFFANLSQKSDITLVLSGSETSGKDILFNHIIKPLFGLEYCSTISDNNLSIRDLDKLTTDKLFLNIKNISNKSLSNKTIKNYFNQFFIKPTKYAQTLITIDQPYLPLFDENYTSYTVFEVPNNITNIIIPEWFEYDYTQTLSKDDLIDWITDDLNNFAKILKTYNAKIIRKALINDDKRYILYSQNDKLRVFSKAIRNKDIKYFEDLKLNNLDLYEEIQSGFNSDKIIQKNVFKSFNVLYPEENISSPKTLMTLFRKIDNNFFSTNAVKIGSGGVKYFDIK